MKKIENKVFCCESPRGSGIAALVCKCKTKDSNMSFKDISAESQTLIKSLGFIEVDLTNFYMNYEDCQLKRIDAERPVISFESFLKQRIAARQFISLMGV